MCDIDGVVDNDDNVVDTDFVGIDVVDKGGVIVSIDGVESDVVCMTSVIVHTHVLSYCKLLHLWLADGSLPMHADTFIHFFWLFPDDDGSDDGDGNTNNTSRAEASSSALPPDDSLSFTCSLIDVCDDDGRVMDFHVSLASAVSCASPLCDV